MAEVLAGMSVGAHVSEPADSDIARNRTLVYAAFIACMTAMWMLMHPFAGVVHDSMLYTLQALARLHPALLNDLFLRYGSQDQFTIFSPLFASAIHWIGLEPAASALTFVTHLAFFMCAWLLARRVMRPDLALLSVGLLIVLPCGYGALQIFNYVEEFLTPRGPAEVLVLAALAAYLGERYLLTAALLAVSMLLHPLMGMAGIFFVLCCAFVMPRPRLAIMLGAIGFGALVAVAYAMPVGPIATFDAQWLAIIEERTRYLFVRLWSLEDWGRFSIPLVTLVIGALTTTRPVVRQISLGALITAACGVAFTFVASDLLHIVIVTQVQPWRWLWLANALAVLLLPIIALDCWRSGPAVRASLLFLVAAWMFHNENVSVIGILLLASVATALFAQHLTEPRRARLVFLCACMTVAIALVSCIAEKFWTLTHEDGADDPRVLVLQPLRIWARDGTLPAILLIFAWWVVHRARKPHVSIAVAALAVVTGAWLFPSTWPAWTRDAYTEESRQIYGELRQHIPAGAEVLWMDSPLGAWYLLERPAYYTGPQGAGVVFSRTAAIELEKRAERVEVLQPGAALDEKKAQRLVGMTPQQILLDVCTAENLEYVVTWFDLKARPVAAVTPVGSRPDKRARLYRCSDVKG